MWSLKATSLASNLTLIPNLNSVNCVPRTNWPSSPSQKNWKPIDESTHQIPSNGLLFSTFYHFPYTADPPTSTMPIQPSLTIAWSSSTIPCTHHTIGPIPCWRPPIWPTNHVVIFSFLSLFSFTWHILLWPNRSQVIALCSRNLTICFTAHEPCACFTYRLYLRLLYLLWKTRKFSPELRLKFVLSHCFTSLHLAPSLYLILLTHFALSHHTKPPSHTTLHSLVLHQETISLLLNRTPQNHIGYTLRSPSPLIFVTS